MNAARNLLIEGIGESAGTLKEAARQLGVSPCLLSKIGNGERHLAHDLKPKVSAMSFKAALAVILEDTGYEKLFTFYAKDRHPLNLLQRVHKEDQEADEAYRQIAHMLTDRPNNEDLDDVTAGKVREQAREIAERVCADVNFLAELDSRYPKLRLKEMFAEKENAPQKRAM